MKRFVCADPPPPLPYGTRDRRVLKTMGAYWERDVQSGLRNLSKCGGTVPSSDIVLVGRDVDGIGAIGWGFQFADDEWWLLGLAVALRLRASGRHFGDELMDEMLNEIASRSDQAGLPEVMVRARIHEKNLNSQKLAERSFFQQGETVLDDPQLLWWEQLMDLRP